VRKALFAKQVQIFGRFGHFDLKASRLGVFFKILEIMEYLVFKE